jgi:hypothetical protein
MPTHYERDDARRRVVITIQGPFEPTDFLAVIERWRGEAVGAYGMLYDLRGMTGEPSIADLRQFMSEAARTTRPRGPLAIVATDPIIYGRACTYATLGRATLTVEVFRNWDEAEHWLTAQTERRTKGMSMSRNGYMHPIDEHEWQQGQPAWVGAFDFPRLPTSQAGVAHDESPERRSDADRGARSVAARTRPFGLRHWHDGNWIPMFGAGLSGCRQKRESLTWTGERRCPMLHTSARYSSAGRASLSGRRVEFI